MLTMPASAPSRSTSACTPASSLPTAKLSPRGCTCTSSRALLTSIPTVISISSPPCLNGLALRPRRLFGIDGSMRGAPCSLPGFDAPGGAELPRITAAPSLPDVADFKLQGEGKSRLGRRRVTPLLQVQTSRLRLARTCFLPRKGGEGDRACAPAPVRSEALSICDCPELAGAAIDELTSSYIMTPLRRLG